MHFEQVTIIGVGLIGGSIGLAAKSRAAAKRVVGVDRDPMALKIALALRAIDSSAATIAEGVKDADLILIAAPVDVIAELILKAASHARPGTIITDTGSTKVAIVNAVQDNVLNRCVYIPAHPLAGTERSGVEHARADLFVDRPVILTPLDGTASTAVARIREFWQQLGCKPLELPPEQHDLCMAFTSHLPHAAASAVAGSITPNVLPFTSTGFRDVTRIASSDPKLWAAIFNSNRDNVLTALSLFINRLDDFYALLEAGDRAAMEQWLTEGKTVRDALGT